METIKEIAQNGVYPTMKEFQNSSYHSLWQWTHKRGSRQHWAGLCDLEVTSKKAERLHTYEEVKAEVARLSDGQVFPSSDVLTGSYGYAARVYGKKKIAKELGLVFKRNR